MENKGREIQPYGPNCDSRWLLAKNSLEGFLATVMATFLRLCQSAAEANAEERYFTEVPAKKLPS